MSVANPVNAAGALKGWKRKGSEEEDDSIKTKKARYSWYVMLASESDQPSSSDEDESIHSVQAHETEYARDTSDTSSHPWSSDDVMQVEYEVASLSGNENPLIDFLTSSDPEDIIRGGVIAAVLCDEDVGLADDSDDSIISRDSEISCADYWTCVQCNNSNNNPMFRYCEKCYQTRKHFFPPRPKGRRRRKSSKKKSTSFPNLEKSTVFEQNKIAKSLSLQKIEKSSSSDKTGQFSSQTMTFSQESFDTGFSSSLSQPGTSFSSQACSILSQDDLTKNEGNNNDPMDNVDPDCGSSQNSIATTVSIDDNTFNNDSDSDQNVGVIARIEKEKKNKSVNETINANCLVCMIGPKDGVFVHGRDSHTCCCYRCAMKVWKTTKHCPICKRRVTDVIKTYYA